MHKLNISEPRPLGRIMAALLLAVPLFFSLVPQLQAAEGRIPILGSGGLAKLVLEEGKGKVIILSVFASWCPPCKEEMPMLTKTRAAFSEDDLMLIGLSVDESMRDLTSFMNRYKVNFPVYVGTGELYAGLEIGPIPHTFFFNRKGELVESVIGLMPELEFQLLLSRLLEEPGA